MPTKPSEPASPTPSEPTPVPAKKKAKENIFANTEMREYALQYKQAIIDGDKDKAFDLISKITEGSRSMFARLAVHEGFDKMVDVDILVQAASVMVPKWVLRWDPKFEQLNGGRGKLFSFLSKCAKNVFKSESNKESTLRKRLSFTGENLEKYYSEQDVEDHPSITEKVSEAITRKLEEVYVRFGDPEELGASRYICECILEDRTNKDAIVRGAACAFCIDPKLAKFFYDCVLIQLRHAMYEHVHIPFTEQDLFRKQHAYTHLVDLLEIVTWSQLKQIIAVHGGQKIRIPPVNELKKAREEYMIYAEIDQSDQTPEDVAAIAKKFRRKVSTVEDIHDRVSEDMRRDNCGEFALSDVSI